MEHNQEISVEPINTSSSKFGVQYENNFVVLDDGKHIIRVDAGDGRSLIIENIVNQKAEKFRYSDCSFNSITNLFYDKTTGFLYTGDYKGKLCKYKIDIICKTYKRVRNYGYIGLDKLYSSHRFLNFLFFGGSNSKIRILDLSSDDLLPGILKTSIESIYSLQVCLKSHDQIFLAVSGSGTNYSKNNTDLFDVSGLFSIHPVILQKYLSENASNHEDTLLHQRNTLKSQKKKIQKLKQERDSYKAELNQMHSKYDDLKNKFHLLHRKIEKLKETNQPQSTQLKTNYTVTITERKFRFENGQYLQTHPLVMTKQPKQKIQEEKHLSKKYQNISYDELHCSTPAEDRAHNLTMTLDASKRQGLQGNIRQK